MVFVLFLSEKGKRKFLDKTSLAAMMIWVDMPPSHILHSTLPEAGEARVQSNLTKSSHQPCTLIANTLLHFPI